ncbi:MAG: hypothetical protein EXR27_16855 [Betaproteobacteria bacterium]|nr:hypothetical protein [Betaproteobacteria bacterium]
MALLLMITLAAIMSAYFVVDGLARTTAAVQNARDQKTLDSLQQAKAALIAYAASQAWNSGIDDQPGSLPCPDTDNDGVADSCGTSTSGRTGRLPWKTLKISDLRDANGELLWYSLSKTFRTASGTTIINSDTEGEISIYDDQYSTSTPVLTKVVAVVIAPGAAVNGQSRTSSSVSAFLDCRNGTLTDAFSFSLPPAGAGSSCPHTTADRDKDYFNDRILPITHADLFSVVEPSVAARIERDLKQYFTAYNTAWGRYPFAATFSNPSTATFLGVLNLQWGLLPLHTTAGFVVWNSPLATTVANTGATSGAITSSSCSSSTTSALICNIYYTGRPTIDITSTLQNVGISIVTPSSVDVTVSNLRGGTNTFTNWSGVGPLAASGIATLSHSLRLPSSVPSSTTGCTKTQASCRHVIVTIVPPSYSAITSSTDAYAGWFIRNQWYRQVYYAVSPALIPGGSGTCTARPIPPAAPSSPSCLYVTNLPSSYASKDDKQAILVFAGRALGGTTRPSGTLSEYLEGANITSNSSVLYAYEHRPGRAGSINDRVVVIAP